MNKKLLLEVQLTGSCNLKCSYCGNSEKYLNRSHADVATVIKAITELKPSTILFTGGEVYLEWELLIELLDMLKDSKYNYILSSNLSLIGTDELDLLIDKYGFSTFHSSFNDLTEEMSWSVRKASAAERLRLIENLKHLCSRGVNVKVETMLIKDTINSLKEINAFLYELGVKNHKLEFLIPMGQAKAYIQVDYYHALDKILQLWESKENDSILIPCCCPVTPCMAPHPIFDISSDDLVFNKCIDGEESCYLLSNGTLLPCFIFPDSEIGCRDYNYYQIWTKEDNFVGMRKRPEKCDRCDYFYDEKNKKACCSTGCKVLNYVVNNEFGFVRNIVEERQK